MVAWAKGASARAGNGHSCAGRRGAYGHNDRTTGAFGSGLAGSGQQECTRGGAGQPGDRPVITCIFNLNSYLI